MANVIIWQNQKSVSVTIHEKQSLQSILSEHGLAQEHPCGGLGICGKCQVTLSGKVSPPNAHEIANGSRLSCQAEIWGDAEVWLEDTIHSEIELSGEPLKIVDQSLTGLGAAVDIGTTTIAIKLYDLHDGKELAALGDINPQRTIAADIMGRIAAAMEGQGKLLKSLIQNKIRQLLMQVCKNANVQMQSIKRMVIAANTTMLYLLTERSTAPLACAPFVADCLFDCNDTLWNTSVYYPPCMSAFVGADITCAVLASGMCEHSEISLLCDIGTNGEIALWKNNTLYVTSTAAGPAFEGVGISCGCGSVPGAIYRVWIDNGMIRAETLHDQPAIGLCGSGLVDAIASYLKAGIIDETGAIEMEALPLRDGISLLPKDIRALQLAKGAIAAGIQTLLQFADVPESDVQRVYIAGGFGSHLNIDSAATIGLIPASFAKCVKVIGNAALSGAAQMLVSEAARIQGKHLAANSVHVNLGGNPAFNENFMEHIMFNANDGTEI